MYTDTNSLFGMDWSPLSMWGQMISNKVVDDTMYLCLGNGGDMYNSSPDAQAGAIIFGTSKIAISGASVGGDVVTMTMLDSKGLKLVPPSMWVQLDALSIAPASGASKPLAMAQANYLIDSGTSYTLLTADAFASLDSVFCSNIIGAVSGTNMTVACGANGDAASGGYTISLSGSDLPTTDQLNSIFPNISFSFSTASAAVNFKPSIYMNYVGKTSTSNQFMYQVHIGKSTETTGLLGNAWMADWLIQQTISTRQLVMTSVKSCNEISYSDA